MRPMLLLVSLLLFVVLVESADARPRLLRKNRGYARGGPTVWENADDVQTRCSKEAAWMAANYAFYHVGANVDQGECWGYGSVPNCATCPVPRGATVTGDASVQCSNGMYFRVIGWRW